MGIKIKCKKMRRIICVFLMFYGFVCVAQVGIGIENPTAAVHFGQNVKLKDVSNVVGSMEEYPQHLIADEKGNLAVFSGLPTNLLFKNVVTKKMNEIVGISINDVQGGNNYDYTEKALNLNTSIVIPPNKTFVFEVTYSVPAMLPGFGNPKGEFGVFAKRKLGNLEFEKIEESVRVFSPTSRTPGTATANGRAVGFTYVDTVRNDTDQPLEVIYDIYGFTDHINLNSYKIIFGAYSNRGENYNWGKGLLMITINELLK